MSGQSIEWKAEKPEIKTDSALLSGLEQQAPQFQVGRIPEAMTGGNAIPAAFEMPKLSLEQEPGSADVPGTNTPITNVPGLGGTPPDGYWS